MPRILSSSVFVFRVKIKNQNCSVDFTGLQHHLSLDLWRKTSPKKKKKAEFSRRTGCSDLTIDQSSSRPSQKLFIGTRWYIFQPIAYEPNPCEDVDLVEGAQLELKGSALLFSNTYLTSDPRLTHLSGEQPRYCVFTLTQMNLTITPPPQTHAYTNTPLPTPVSALFCLLLSFITAGLPKGTCIFGVLGFVTELQLFGASAFSMWTSTGNTSLNDQFLINICLFNKVLNLWKWSQSHSRGCSGVADSRGQNTTLHASDGAFVGV